MSKINKLIWAFICCYGNAYAIASTLELDYRPLAAAILGSVFYILFWPKEK